MGAIIASIGSALVTGLLALMGVIITNSRSNLEIQNKLTTSQAVTDSKLENLTEEVRRHNNFASKIPVIEDRLDRLEDDVKELKTK